MVWRNTPYPYCKGCGLTPDELEEYDPKWTGSPLSRVNFVCRKEHTFNPETNRFYCTACYLQVGSPPGLADAEKERTPGLTTLTEKMFRMMHDPDHPVIRELDKRKFRLGHSDRPVPDDLKP